MTAMRPRENESFRPPAVSFAMASVTAAAALMTVRHPILGFSELSGLVCLGLSVGAIKLVIRAFDDQAKLRRAAQKQQIVSNAMKSQGQARFADEHDVEQAGLFAEEGVFLGALPCERKCTRDLRYNGDCSVNVVGPPGSLKSLGVAVPTLLTDLGHSRIVCDPSGELFALTHKFLGQHHNVEVICPWPEEAAVRTGGTIKDAGFDVFYDYDPEAAPHTMKGYVQRKLELVLPRKPSFQSDEKSEFFRQGGLELLLFPPLYLIWRDTKPTLPRIRSLLREGAGSLTERLKEASASDAFGGSLREVANSLLGTLTVAGETFAGFQGVADQALSLYDAGSEMGIHCAKSFDPRTLKNDGRPTTVFLIWPRDRARTHQAALNTTISALFEAVAQDPRKARVTAVVDEIASCGRLANLLPALNEYRKYGLRVVSLWQDLLGGQAESIYGQAGMKQIVAAAPVLAAFNVNSHETLELLSKMTGTVARLTATLSERGGWNDPLPQSNVSQGHQNRPLLNPDEIRQLPDDQALIFTGNTPVIQATKVPYFTRPEFNQLCGLNPYYRASS